MCFFFLFYFWQLLDRAKRSICFLLTSTSFVEGKRERETYLNLVFLDCTYKREIKVWWSVVEKQTRQTCAPFFLCLRVVFHVTIIYKKKKKKCLIFSFFISHFFVFFGGICGLFPRQIDGQSLMGLEEKSCQSARSVSFSPFLAPHRKRHQENHKS